MRPLFIIAAVLASDTLSLPAAERPTDRDDRRVASMSSAARESLIPSLPDISEFKDNPSGRFLVDMEVVREGFPYKGKRAERPHTGGHVYFHKPEQPLTAKDVSSFPAIYAVADGVIDRIDYSFPLQEMFEPALKKRVANRRYGIGLLFAKRKDGTPVSFHYSIEPFIDPGDDRFYEPFILVEPGQKVRKGEIIARMYLPSNPWLAQKSHIHFNLTGGRSRPFMAPTIFDAAIVKEFQAKWGLRGTDGDSPIPPTMGFKLALREDPFSSGENPDAE